jgi:hypothetical protein
VVAPCTYIGLAFGAAPGDCIHFGSLEFTDINGLAPVLSLIPVQALHFRDPDFIADHQGQPRLSKENAALSHISTLNHGVACASPTIVDSDALACRIEAYLRVNPKSELS